MDEDANDANEATKRATMWATLWATKRATKWATNWANRNAASAIQPTHEPTLYIHGLTVRSEVSQSDSLLPTHLLRQTAGC